MQISIDNWFLESLFARFRMAAHLVDHIDDTIVARELAQSISGITHRLAELLGRPYGSQVAEELSGSPMAGEPTEDGESAEHEVTRLLDDLCEAVARADAFTCAAESLIRELVEEDQDDRRFAHLAHLVGATADAMLEADDVGRVLAIKVAQCRREHVCAAD
jgi:hypothetical protein